MTDKTWTSLNCVWYVTKKSYYGYENIATITAGRVSRSYFLKENYMHLKQKAPAFKGTVCVKEIYF